MAHPGFVEWLKVAGRKFGLLRRLQTITANAHLSPALIKSENQNRGSGAQFGVCVPHRRAVGVAVFFLLLARSTVTWFSGPSLKPSLSFPVGQRATSEDASLDGSEAESTEVGGCLAVLQQHLDRPLSMKAVGSGLIFFFFWPRDAQLSLAIAGDL